MLLATDGDIDAAPNRYIGPLNRKDHVGMAVYVDLANNTQFCRFRNTAGEMVSVYNLFAEGPARKESVLELKQSGSRK